MHNRLKIISNEPSDKDIYTIIISIMIILLAYIVLGFFLYTTNQEIPQTIATIILATVTVIATFQNQIRNWWKRPKIKIFPNAEHSIVENNNIKYFRVKIRNFGRGAAEECYVRLTQAVRLDSHSSISDPINLKWSGAPWNDSIKMFKETKTIPPRGGRSFFDIAVIEDKLEGPLDFVSVVESLKERYNAYILGSLGETRQLEIGKSDYLIYITIHFKNDYSQNFELYIHNSKNPKEIWIENITNKPFPKKD